MVGVGRSAASHDLADDVGPAGLGMLQGLQHQGAGSFTEDESIAVDVERSRRHFRLLISGRQRLHGAESSDARLHHGRFGSTRHHGIGLAIPYGIEGVDDGVCGAGTGGNAGVVGTPEPEFHADVTGGDVSDHLRNEERIEAGRPVAFDEILDLLLEGEDAPDAAAEDDPHPVRVGLRLSESGVRYGLTGRHDAVLSVRIQLALLLAVEMVSGVPALQFTGELGLEFGRIEAGDGTGSADSLFQGVEISGNVIAQRSQATHSRDDDTVQLHAGLTSRFRCTRWLGRRCRSSRLGRPGWRC